MATARRLVQATMGVRTASNDAHAQIRDMEAVLLGIINGFRGLESALIIKNALQPTFLKARDVYTPKDTGDLRASGFLEIVRFRGNARVDIGFGKGGKPSYAPIVHEDMSFYHKPPTRSKFLQAAVAEDTMKIEVRMGVEYRKMLGRNARTGRRKKASASG